jgi:mRNA interferase MazF
MKRGEIALAVLPQTDGEEKSRPVLLLGRLPGYGDWLVLGISSQVAKAVDDWDLKLDPTLAEFRKTGLKAPSIVRLGFVATIPSARIRGVIGTLPPPSLDVVVLRLSDFIVEGQRP